MARPLSVYEKQDGRHAVACRPYLVRPEEEALLEKTRFFVELLSTRMQRHAERGYAIQRRVWREQLALCMSVIQQLARIVVPNRRRDAIDQLFGQI